jgi:hypothetical protein
MEDTYSRSKLALQQLQRFFQEKLIDPDLPAVGREQWGQQIEGGQVGFFIRGYGLGGNVNYGGGPDMGDNVLGNNPDARLVNTYYPLAPDGTTKCPMDSSTISLNSNEAFSVKHDVSDEKLARILQIYDYVNHDPQGHIWTHRGVEGVNWDWVGPEPFNCLTGHAQVRPEDQQDSVAVMQNFYHAYRLVSSLNNCFIPKSDDPLVLRRLELNADRGSAHGLRHGIPNAREDIASATSFNELWAQFGAALTTLKQEFWWKAITTDIDIDAEWPGYVNTWMNAGGRQVLDELQKSPTSADILSGSF